EPGVRLDDLLASPSIAAVSPDDEGLVAAKNHVVLARCLANLPPLRLGDPLLPGMKQHLAGQPTPLLFQRGGLMGAQLVGPFPPGKVPPVIGDGAEERKRVEPLPLLFQIAAQRGGASAPGAPVALLEAVKSAAQRRSLQGQDQIVANSLRRASF